MQCNLGTFQHGNYGSTDTCLVAADRGGKSGEMVGGGGHAT